MVAPTRQLLSLTSYPADGVTTVWDFSFASGYIDKAHVKAKYITAAGVQQVIAVTPSMFIGPFQLNITPPVPAGALLTIFRDTPKDAPLVNFADKAVFTETSLDINAKQAIFVAAEAIDASSLATLGGGVDSINGETGDVTLTKSSIGLGAVNNTADIDKPVSSATAAAIASAVSGGPGGVVKIAFIGDSLTTQNALLNDSPTSIVERTLKHMGFSCEVAGFGRNGHTFHRANTVAYIGGKTSVQATIDYAPDVVVIALGVNDTAGAVDGRTLAQAQADVLATVAALRAGLPGVKIMYGSETPFDTVNFTPNTVKNKGSVPGWMTLRTVGIFAGMFSSEILEDAVALPMRTRLQNWVDLDSYIKLSVGVDSYFDINLWRIARMGGVGNDSIHLNAGGRTLAAGYILKGMRAYPSVFNTLFSNNFGWWEDPDFLFADLLTPSGTGYLYSGSLYAEAQDALNFDQLHPQTWYMPLDASVNVTPYVENSGTTMFMWTVYGSRPGKPVKASVGGGAFNTIPVLTDPKGRAWGIAAGADTGGFVLGTNTLRYAVDNICFDPISVTYAEPASRFNGFALLNGWVPFDVNTFTPGYAKNKDGMVTLRGIVKDGAASPATSLIGVLPVGFRPKKACVFGSIAALTPAVIQVDPSGEVYVTGNRSGITLDGVFFYVT